MKAFFLLHIFLIFNFAGFAQNNETWNAFWNKDTTLIGFKDKNGTIKIEPKFMGCTYASKFDDIVAVTVEKGDSWESYYLTKSGKIVGVNSMFTSDNTSDCESEGYIRFTDPKTEQMGLFDANGEIAVPAEYNYMTQVHNGILVVLKGAHKINENHGHEGCNHFSWSGGKEYLIDTNNKILVENFSYNSELNLYSLQITKTPHPDGIWESFLGTDGQYYSFINYEKEFLSWLNDKLFADLSQKNLIENSFDEIAYSKKSGDWIHESKLNFFTHNYKFLKQKLKDLQSKTTEYFIMNGGPYLFIEEDGRYEKYFNNCYKLLQEKYPVKTIVVSQKIKKETRQDNLLFLRTDDGYKLIEVSSTKNNLK